MVQPTGKGKNGKCTLFDVKKHMEWLPSLADVLSFEFRVFVFVKGCKLGNPEKNPQSRVRTSNQIR